MSSAGVTSLPIVEGFTSDPARSYTLPARFYFDPAIHEREREEIFYKTWQFAGHVENVRKVGDYMAMNVLDQDIFVIRDKSRELRAFYNVCRHRAHRLLEGQGHVKGITCPYHAWAYSLDGRLKTARGTKEVEGFDRDAICLSEVRVENVAGFIFVNLDPDAIPLAEQAPELVRDLNECAPGSANLTRARRLEFDLKTNWKVAADNFLECNHCPNAHPALCELIDIRNYRSKTYAIHSTHFSPALQTDAAVYPVKPDDAVQVGVFIYLWPNTAFGIFPGSSNINVLHIIPDGPERVHETWDFYFDSRDMSEAEEAQVKYVDEILNPEDIALCESVQRGLHSRGYNQGRFIVDRDRTNMSEHAVHHFQSLVREALGETGCIT